MIVVKLNGGIGAQMIQYSLGRYLSLLNGTELYLDGSWFSEYNTDENFPRDFKLNCLKVNYKLFNKKSILWRARLSKRNKLFNPFAYKTVYEKDFSKFDDNILKLGNNIILDGYWNSYKYFENIKGVLSEELSPRDQPNPNNKNCLNKIINTNAVSVHFRRGDYSKTSFHGILNNSYYEAALNIIKQKVADPYLFIFSDEPEWVIRNFDFDLPYEIVDFNGNDNNYWDIELMKHCKHHIIANSSFSWWGAWLNSNASKIVIAPKIWIAEEKRQMKDFIPLNWIRIHC
jgi:hypothetical protein